VDSQPISAQSGSKTHGRLATLEIDDPRWTAFVAAHPAATPFHQPCWATVLADCYNFTAHAAVSVDATGAVIAGIPVIEIGRSRHRWVSLPFTDRCGVLSIDRAIAAELVHLLDKARGELDLRGIVIRDHERTGWSTVEGHWHQLDLRPDPEFLFRHFHTLRRRLIRRAAREGVVVERAQSLEDLIQVFYELHLATRRRLGVPVQPRRFFELLWERMLAPGLGFLLIARHRGVPIASALFLAANGWVTYKFSASDRGYGNLGATDALLWNAIQEAHADGARSFDFGRTETGNEGLRAFKLGWGACEHPLHYTVLAPTPPSHKLKGAHELLKPVIRHSPKMIARAIGALAYRYTA
jgi:CelD/BcsL family acetyltransferase involved in cellulose biosynthesis